MLIEQSSLPGIETSLLHRSDLLRDFLAVVTEGGVRAAAARVHLSQSALTRRIQELERTLNVQLFERNAQGMRLTRFGEALRHHAQLIDQTCHYAVSELNDLREGGAGELRLAAGPAWDSALVPDAIIEVQKVYPKIRFLVSSRHNEGTLPLLADARIDLVLGAIAEKRQRDPQITYEHVLDIEHRVFANAGHPMQGNAGLRPRDLQQIPWIWFAEAVTSRAALQAWFGRARFAPPESSVEITSMQAAVRLMQKHDFLMLLPSTLTRVMAERNLKPLRLGEPVGSYSAGLMYRPSALRLRAFSELRRHVFALAREHQHENDRKTAKK